MADKYGTAEPIPSERIVSPDDGDSFDLHAGLSTVERLEALHPKMILYTHFGVNREAQSALQTYRQLLGEWVERVEGVWWKKDRDAETTVRTLLDDPELQRWPYNDHAPQAELEMCVRGVLHYLKRREAEGE